MGAYTEWEIEREQTNRAFAPKRQRHQQLAVSLPRRRRKHAYRGSCRCRITLRRARLGNAHAPHQRLPAA
jgi:hypothetical protein